MENPPDSASPPAPATVPAPSRGPRIAASIFLGMVGLLGLFMTLCGAGFTLSMIGPGNDGWEGLLVLTLPCMLIGIGIVWAVVRWFTKPRDGAR